MMNGRNNGKKLMAVRIVAHSFEIVCLHLYEFGDQTIVHMISHSYIFLPNTFTYLNLSHKALLTPTFLDPHHDRPKPHPSRR